MANTAAVGSPDTIVCSACWTAMPAESHFCNACGAQVSSTVSGPQRLASLLSEANLCRMRAQWVDAENRCIEAMRLQPNSLDAHSLLGDIYRDQGKLEDAAQWYHLALDLDPTSTGDKAKLAAIERQQSKKAVGDVGVIKPNVSPTVAAAFGTQKLMGLQPATWLQAITGAAVVFVIIIIGIAISMRGGRTSAETPPFAKPESQPSSNPDPISGSPQQGSAPTTAYRSTGPSPAPLVPFTPGAMGTNAPPLESPAPESVPSAAPDDSSDPITKTVIRTVPLGSTDYERNLRKFVVEKARLGRETAIGAIMVDPRHPRASFVISLAPRRADPVAVRGAAMRSATRVAVAAMAGDSVLTTVTVNVRLKSGADRFLPVFAGDMDRTSAQSLGENPSLEEMVASYSSYWWAPNFTPANVPPAGVSAQPAP